MIETSQAKQKRLSEELEEKLKKVAEIAGNIPSARIALGKWEDYCLQCFEEMKTPIAETELQKACLEHQSIAEQLRDMIFDNADKIIKHEDSEPGGSIH